MKKILASVMLSGLLLVSSNAMAFTQTATFTVGITVQPTVTITTNNIAMTEVTPGTPGAGFQSASAALVVTAPAGLVVNLDYTAANPLVGGSFALVNTNTTAANNPAPITYKLVDALAPAQALGTVVTGGVISSLTGGGTINLQAKSVNGDYGVWGDTITVTATY
jgi:hypothetical protein